MQMTSRQIPTVWRPVSSSNCHYARGPVSNDITNLNSSRRRNLNHIEQRQTTSGCFFYELFHDLGPISTTVSAVEKRVVTHCIWKLSQTRVVSVGDVHWTVTLWTDLIATVVTFLLYSSLFTEMVAKTINKTIRKNNKNLTIKP